MLKSLLIAAFALLFTACGHAPEEKLNLFETDIVPFHNSDDGMSFIDMETAWVTDTDFHAPFQFRDGVLLVKDQNKTRNPNQDWSYVDKDFKPLFDKKFVFARSFSDGVAWVKDKDFQVSAIDKKGNVLFTLAGKSDDDYFFTAPFFDGYAPFNINMKYYGILDKNGDCVVEPDYSRILHPVNGLVAVMDTESYLWGIIDLEGNVLVECKYHGIGGVADMYSIVPCSNIVYKNNYIKGLAEDRIIVQEKDSHWGVINKKGKTIIPCIYDDIAIDGENYLVCVDYKFGWVNKNNKWVIPPIFEEAAPFYGKNYTRAKESRRGYEGIINTKGKWIKEPVFNKISEFNRDGIACAQDGETRGYGTIDRKGNWVLEPTYGELNNFYDGTYLSASGKKGGYYLMDHSGNIISDKYYRYVPQEDLYMKFK